MRGGALGRLGDRLDVACPFLGGNGRQLEQIGRGADDREQIVEVVRDAAGKSADRLHLLRLRHRLAGALQLLLRLCTCLSSCLRLLGWRGFLRRCAAVQLRQQSIHVAARLFVLLLLLCLLLAGCQLLSIILSCLLVNASWCFIHGCEKSVNVCACLLVLLFTCTSQQWGLRISLKTPGSIHQYLTLTGVQTTSAYRI